MSVVDVERHGIVAISEGDHEAAYQATEWPQSSRPASATSLSMAPIRLHLEALRRLGGLSPRALIGGQFVPGPGDRTQISVGVAGFGLFGAEDEPTCASRLWNQPFTIGLPSEFARSVARTLGEGPQLPSGMLTIDRAGFDPMNSSEMVFAQTASVLQAVLVARVGGEDADEAARAVVRTW
ncbi:hypothetical protein [Amycolatopsis sp. cmx-11-51]|uniref:hypothetical protein n=1 Tax=Amycolatopsis sp. cmx-11-51 TaxID=2785797 RepID=UPI0039E6C483